MRIRLIATSLSLALLAACAGNDPTPRTDATAAGEAAPRTVLGRHIKGAMDTARKELHTKNMSLGEHVHFSDKGVRTERDTSLPKGEITPAGDLLIDGKTVPVDATQRALLLEYRAHIIAIAEAGMDLGVRGADLGMEAAGEAIRGIFSGNPDQIEKRIEARAAGIEAEANKLCERLPAMRATQDRLAAALPAFKPYARMDQSDIDNCRTSTRDDKTREQVRAEIRERIRGSVRGAAQAAEETGRGSGNAAEQAEADSVAR